MTRTRRALASTAVPGSDIDRLTGGIAGKAIAIADLGDPTLLVNRGHSDHAQRDVTTPFVLYAAGRAAIEQRSGAQLKRRNGAFADAVLDAMAGPGDRDANGLLTLNELAAYVDGVLNARWGERYASEQSGRGWLDIRLFEVPRATAAR